ncbi:BamA/TamA family outer membrane protein [bacterium]|nr:BamA/TamA family outer membrane protein [bacterium]
MVQFNKHQLFCRSGRKYQNSKVLLIFQVSYYYRVIFVGFFLFINQIISQPVVRDIEIYGAKKLSKSVLIKRTGLVKNQPLPKTWPDSCMKMLTQYLYQQGFYQSRIDSFGMRYISDSAQVRINLWLHEGKKVKVGEYQINGLSPAFYEEIEPLLFLSTNAGFYEKLLSEDIEQILIYMENNGHPLAVVEVKVLDYTPLTNTIKIILSVKPGPRIYLNRYDIQGNKFTKPKVILREIRFKPGNLYSHKETQKISEDLQRLGFFEQVNEPEVYFTEDQAVVFIRVREGNPNTLDGVVGYTPSNDPERPGYFTGQLHFLFRNLAGTGRFFEAFWEKKDKYSQAMRFGYEEPWLRGWPIHIGGYFTQEIRDTTYVDRGWRMRVRYTPSAVLSLFVEGGQREILPDSLGSVLYDLAQTKSWVGTLGLDYTTFDMPLNPRKGVCYHTAATFGRKHNLGPAFMDTIPQWKEPVNTRHIRADAELVIPVSYSQAVFVGLHGQEVKSGGDHIPISEQIRFGGTNSLRGYAEDQFRGSLVAWFNLEYRYLFGDRSRIFTFIDAGMYQRREKGHGLIRHQKIGYGFGIRLETRLGVVGVDYGLGHGDDLMQGKVHVGLVNQF